MIVPSSSYVICTTPRSGSWMLCSILSQLGLAGVPAEFFGPTLGEELVGNHNLVHAEDVHGYLDHIMHVSTTENGVFGTKLLANQTEVFLRRASEYKEIPFSSLRTALESVFPHLQYIWLKRENIIAQSISLYRAFMTNQWYAYGAVSGQTMEVTYDRFAIQRCYQEVVTSDTYWEGYFKAHSITPLALTYEELLTDRSSVVQHLLRYLDLPSDIPIPAPQTFKLSNEESLAWEEEFRKTRSMPPPAPLPPKLWAPY